jgi:hypothetical protein
MSEPDEPKPLSEQYPSVELAYPIALASYEIAAKRWEAVDGRLQTVMAIGTALVLAAPAAFKALNITASKSWLLASLALYLAGCMVGIYARLLGRLVILSPTVLYEKWLHLGPWEFKKDLIYFAGEHQRENIATLEKKQRLAVVMIAAFLLGAAALLLAAFLP